MTVVLFELTGDLALWRNVYDSIGSYSAPGPAPSAVAGLCGAALGFAAPRSMAAFNPNAKSKKKELLKWPLSPELLQWEHENDYHVCCRWIGKSFRRISWNTNGLKNLVENGYFRIQQQVIEKPAYEIGVGVSDSAAHELAEALRTPAFPLYSGCSFCPAMIRKIRLTDSIPPSPDWAFRMENAVSGECTPFSRHKIEPDEEFGRMKIDGYWVYPVPGMPGPQTANPLVKGYVE